MRQIDLSGKTAIVTGASQGIGKATAATLHNAGANVVVNYFEDDSGQNLANANATVSQLGERAAAISGDVRDRDSVQKLIESTVDQFGHLDIVINNAGIIRDRTLKKMSSEEWQAVIDTNLTGTFNVCREAVDRMRDGGRIVNLSSIAAALGSYGQANYVATKAGVSGFTKVLARELGKRAINVNAVAPGVVNTEMGNSIPAPILEQMKVQVPLERFAEPNEIADVILFLCSDLAQYVTGQTIHVNGGWFAG